MKAFKIDMKQQKMINEFFKEETTYFPDHVLKKFAGILLSSISCLLLIVPVNAWGDDRIVMLYGFMLFAMGIYAYASKYASFSEPLTKHLERISELTRYLPVNRIQLTVFRIRKILKPCVICAAAVIFFRLLFTAFPGVSLSVWDIVLPVLLMVVWPALIELTRY